MATRFTGAIFKQAGRFATGLVVGLACCMPSYGQAQPPTQIPTLTGVRLDLAVHGMTARQLLMAIADVTNTHWVVGSGVLEQAVSMSAAHVDAASLVAGLLAAEKLHWVRHNNINLVLSPCRYTSGLGQRASLPPSPHKEMLSLNFQQVPVSALVAVLGDFSGQGMAASSMKQLVSLRTRDQPWTDVLRALLITEDMASLTMTSGTRTKWAAYWPENYACPKPAQPDPAAQAATPMKDPSACKRKRYVPESRHCDPLEHYPTEQLLPKGYITLSKLQAGPPATPAAPMYVMLQTPEGLLHLKKPSPYDYVGDQMGRITAADRTGFWLEEFLVENQQSYVQTTLITYTGERSVVSKVLQRGKSD